MHRSCMMMVMNGEGGESLEIAISRFGKPAFWEIGSSGNRTSAIIGIDGRIMSGWMMSVTLFKEWDMDF